MGFCNSGLSYGYRFLEVGDISTEVLQQLDASSAPLISPLGYRSLDVGVGQRSDLYHGVKTVWPFEQAIIHQAGILSLS
jgi:hypothetical protein